MTEKNNGQPLDYGMNATDEQQKLHMTDEVSENWLTASKWLKITGGALYFATFLLFSMMLKLGNDGIVGLLFLIAVLVLIAAIFFWKTGAGIGSGVKAKQTETVQNGFKILMNIYQYLGSIAIMLCLLGVFLLIVELTINFSNDTF